MPTEQRPLKVFLCHASADKPKVREIYRTLKRRGVQPWLDAENLIPGQNWEVEIPKALLSSDAIIICLTPNSIDKEGYVQKEIKFALDKALEMPEGRIFLIPAKLEECDLPFSLRQYQAVNLYEKEDEGFIKLMKALKLRASQLERKTVELPKEIELAPEIKKVVEEKSGEIPKPKTENSKHSRIKPLHKLNTTILVALIGFAGTIIATLLSSPIIEKWFSPAPVSPAIITPATAITPTSAPWPTPTQYNGSLPFEIIDDFGFKMNLVPAGEFIMGRDNGEYSEKPLHQVYVEAFYIDQYEVTTAHYKDCVDKGICNPPSSTESFYSGSSYYDNPDYANYPVFYVDWDQAKTFCEWRGAQLPTEAQWEKAARGTDGRLYPWGEGIDCSNANYYSCLYETYKVGSYEGGKSPYGIYDTAGNVWEWVDSWYDAYPGNPVPDLDYGTKYRVMRGGSYSDSDKVRSSYRGYYAPNTSSLVIGFRCALTVTP